MEKKVQLTHYFDLGFEVVSTEQNPDDLGVEEVREAILKFVRNADKETLICAVEHYNTCMPDGTAPPPLPL